MTFVIALICVSMLAGAVASVTGFGIGSLVTPLLALQVDTKLAVAAVSIPHFCGTLLRCWMMRKDIDRKVLLSFGITSAIGGLSGALLHNVVDSPVLTLVFGAILMFAGSMGAAGISERWKWGGWVATAAGALSGLLGGLVGNQGGIRSAAMLGFGLSPQGFVATATAIGVVVDLARMPVYIYAEYQELSAIWMWILLASSAVVGGTFGGTLILQHLDRNTFKRLVSGAVFVLGSCMLCAGIFGRIR